MAAFSFDFMWFVVIIAGFQHGVSHIIHDATKQNVAANTVPHSNF
jgi:hypothetical protein